MFLVIFLRLHLKHKQETLEYAVGGLQVKTRAAAEEINEITSSATAAADTLAKEMSKAISFFKLLILTLCISLLLSYRLLT